MKSNSKKEKDLKKFLQLKLEAEKANKVKGGVKCGGKIFPCVVVPGDGIGG